eukprot:3321647-Rhodomonas_salina.1
MSTDYDAPHLDRLSTQLASLPQALRFAHRPLPPLPPSLPPSSFLSSSSASSHTPLRQTLLLSANETFVLCCSLCPLFTDSDTARYAPSIRPGLRSPIPYALASPIPSPVPYVEYADSSAYGHRYPGLRSPIEDVIARERKTLPRDLERGPGGRDSETLGGQARPGLCEENNLKSAPRFP